MENRKTENIDDVIAYADSLPDFTNKALVLQRLGTGNLNRYQEALLSVNEILATDIPAQPDMEGRSVSKEQLQTLVDRIALLGAQDLVAE